MLPRLLVEVSLSIIGLSGYHSDSAAAGLAEGQFVAGVEEERFTRVKHWAGYPERSVAYCFDEACGGSLGELEAIAIAHDPAAHGLRKIALVATHPRLWGFALGRARHRQQMLGIDEMLARQFGVDLDGLPPVHRVRHHVAHAASAFFCSPWDEAMVVTCDGFGDFESGMRAVGRGSDLEVHDRVRYPHSLGLFYSAITQYLGFPKFGDEYKMMGLAAFGEPSLVDELGRLVRTLPDGRYSLDQSYFVMLNGGSRQTWDEHGSPVNWPIFTDKLIELLGQPARLPDDELTDFHRDVAASAQAVFERHYFTYIRSFQRKTGLRKLTLAGGCALNSLANGKLFDETDIDDVFIQPAAHDGGNSLGAALYLQHAILGRPREFVMEHSLWGPEPTAADIRRAVAAGVPGSNGGDGTYGEFAVEHFTDDALLLKDTAAAIANGDVVGWYQGRSEWGPRALGNRSLLADPRRGDMREVLNVKIKRRETFRPFAPSILAERTGDWFTIDYPDPFMLKVYPIKAEKRAEIPAVTHADGTGRLQTVTALANPRYHALISAFEQQTGIPLVLNTSLNENEPIVNTPDEAIDVFRRTKMDRLVLDRTVVKRVAG